MRTEPSIWRYSDKTESRGTKGVGKITCFVGGAVCTLLDLARDSGSLRRVFHSCARATSNPTCEKNSSFTAPKPNFERADSR